MYHSLLTHSPTEGYLGCFQVLAIVSKDATHLYADFCIDVIFQLLSVNTKE